MKPKNQRLALIAAALVALVGAVLLAMLGLKEQAAYFLTPADIAAGKAVEGRAMRLGALFAVAKPAERDYQVALAQGADHGLRGVAEPRPGLLPARQGIDAIGEGKAGHHQQHGNGGEAVSDRMEVGARIGGGRGGHDQR